MRIKIKATLKRYGTPRVRSTVGWVIPMGLAAMRHMALSKMLCRAMLIASLISSCLLMGCESNFDHFVRFYKPAATREGAPAVALQPRATAPRLVYSHDPNRDGRLLWQHGYVLIGTTSFNGAPDLSYEDHAVAQGRKVGAAIVLMMNGFSDWVIPAFLS